MKDDREQYKVYVNTDSGVFPDDWAFAAWHGFMNKSDQFSNFIVKTFEEKDIESLPFADNVIIVCGVEGTRRYLNCNDIPDIAPFNIPDQLNKPEYLGRTLEVMTAEDFLTNAKAPIFVKPHSIVKQFAAGPISRISTAKMEFEYNNVKGSDLVLTSSVVDFLSEYRCFISNGKIYGVKHYQGDFRVFPDLSIVDRMIKDFTDAPLAYTLDIGVVKEVASVGDFQNNTYLVEAQDMWSIGNYGLDSRIYATLLHRRWAQIIQPYL